jgi:hypothetical protein
MIGNPAATGEHKIKLPKRNKPRTRTLSDDERAALSASLMQETDLALARVLSASPPPRASPR